MGYNWNARNEEAKSLILEKECGDILMHTDKYKT